MIKNPLSNNVMLCNLISNLPTNIRDTHHNGPPVQLTKIDQMSQSNIESDNLTGRRDH